jgi:hypothetical protein
MGEQTGNETGQPPKDEAGAVAFSNGIRLTLRQWLGVGLFAVALAVYAPVLWERVEDFSLEPDYRMPYDLSNDYWLYERYAGLAADQYDTLLLGDSVVWGQYVTRQETLSHYLNEGVGRQGYVNLGLNGAHPLALGGLVEHYGRGIAGKNVVVLCNPLWMSSPRADLQDDRAEVNNHPRLIPQFAPRIPSYKEEVSPRLGILVEQRLPFNKWTNHLQQAYYRTDVPNDIPSWTLAHPYDNPLKPLTRSLPPSDYKRHEENIPWYARGIKGVDHPWVDLQTSLQWPAFQRVVQLLRQRGNRVFVLVGPFNEHLLTPASRQRYQQVKATISAWLQAEQVAHVVPAPLPSAQYGDASHPLAAGYALLARQLLEDPAFRSATSPGGPGTAPAGDGRPAARLP